jgi:hypothetical protein
MALYDIEISELAESWVIGLEERDYRVFWRWQRHQYGF